MTKTAPLKFISRRNLIATLDMQYMGHNPFIIKKDGRSEYDFLHDKLDFICCNNMEHKHNMTPVQMLQLKYMYGQIACPICFKERGGKITTIHKDKDALIGEDTSNIIERKKYMESDDPVENAKREAELQAKMNEEAEEWQRKMRKKEDSGPQRTPQEYDEPKTKEPEEDIVEEEVVESMDYDEYIKENPNYENEVQEQIKNKQPQIEEDEEPICESIPYDEYIGKKKDPLNPDDWWEAGEEEGSQYSRFFNKDEQEEDSNLPQHQHIGANGRIDSSNKTKEKREYIIENPDAHEVILKAQEELKNNQDNIIEESDEDLNQIQEQFINEQKEAEVDEPIYEGEDYVEEETADGSESEYSNNDNANILLDREKEMSDSDEEEEEDIDFDKFK